MPSTRNRKSHALLRPRQRTTTRPPPRWSPKQVYAWAVLFAASVLAVIIPTQAPRTGAAHPALEHKWDKGEGGTVGVAIHLGPEGGLASTYDKNGSTINVARTPGSPAYAAFMRDASSLPRARPWTRFCDTVANLQIELPRLIPTPLSCLSPAVLVVRPLIAALKAEVEAHLGTRICFAALVVDDTKRGALRQAAAAALESVGLATVRVTRGKLYRFGGCLPFSRYEVDHVASHSLFPIVDGQVARMEPLPAEGEKAWTVLVVHYEPHSFHTARFWIGGEQEVKAPFGAEIQVQAKPATLGKGKERVRAVPGGLAAPVIFQDADSTWVALEAHLRAERPYPEAPPHIDRLILSGPSAHDPKLHALLTDILGESLTDSAYVDEDVFTAARGVAAGAYAAMQDPSFGTQYRGWPVFACQCASGLHANRWSDVLAMARWDLTNRVMYDARNTAE
ncbi:hypothetical protein PMIN02_011711 [Paraphaeosphaeria minitans]